MNDSAQTAISHQVLSMNCVNPAAPELAFVDLGSQTPASAPPLFLAASASISAASEAAPIWVIVWASSSAERYRSLTPRDRSSPVSAGE